MSLRDLVSVSCSVIRFGIAAPIICAGLGIALVGTFILPADVRGNLGKRVEKIRWSDQ